MDEDLRIELKREASPLINILRVFGILCFILGAAEIGLGATIFNFLSSFHPGAWYVGVTLIVVCIFGYLLEKSVTLITVACLCILCVIVGIIGSLIDGITWSVLDHTRGCYSPYNDVYTGQDSYQTQAMDCVSSSLIGDSSTKGRCYCVQANNAMCYHYTIRDSSKYDCHDLLTQYTHWLHDSMTICIVITLGSLIYSIFLCTGGCSNILNRTQRANTNASGPSGPVTAYPAFMESEDAHRPLIEEATAPEYPIDSFVKQGGGGPVHAQPYNPNYNQKA